MRIVSYDATGKVVTPKILEYYSEKQRYAYIYEYDSRGNWIKKITSIDLGFKDSTHLPPASKAAVTSREISYY